MTKQALLTFIKNPEKGKVKTRLAKTVGEDKALAIYKSLLDHTRKIALTTVATRFLFYSQHISTIDNWLTKDFIKLVQANGGLGFKMQEAFRHAFQTHQKVVIIGSDCASLTPSIVEEAFQQLDQHDFVIGPALDGGYYLLGMNAFYPAVFKGIIWSTETVLEETQKRILSLQKTSYLLPALSDIDYEEDWEKYGWEV